MFLCVDFDIQAFCETRASAVASATCGPQDSAETSRRSRRSCGDLFRRKRRSRSKRWTTAAGTEASRTGGVLDAVAERRRVWNCSIVASLARVAATCRGTTRSAVRDSAFSASWTCDTSLNTWCSPLVAVNYAGCRRRDYAVITLARSIAK